MIKNKYNDKEMTRINFVISKEDKKKLFKILGHRETVSQFIRRKIFEII
jgi:hypothetical protein